MVASFLNDLIKDGSKSATSIINDSASSTLTGIESNSLLLNNIMDTSNTVKNEVAQISASVRVTLDSLNKNLSNITKILIVNGCALFVLLIVFIIMNIYKK